MTKVFVSSTWNDLQEHRKAVRDTIDRLRHQGISIEWLGMEAFVACDKEPLEGCLRFVDEADVYLGILGVRYGSIDPKTGLSFTEIEYRKAVERSIPRLLFIPTPQQEKVLADYSEASVEGKERLECLKEEWQKARMKSPFASPDDLAKEVAIALIPHVASGDINQLKELSARVKNLKDEIGKYKKSMEDQLIEIIYTIREGKKLVLALGEAGSGKTVLMKRLGGNVGFTYADWPYYHQVR